MRRRFQGVEAKAAGGVVGPAKGGLQEPREEASQQVSPSLGQPLLERRINPGQEMPGVGAHT